eukprot:m.807543 g.807543  ORF g.807543 m.807543 type:complete len:50 (+) comp23379_c1_seq11:2996-3145(+)
MRTCMRQVHDLRACVVPLDTSRTVSQSSAMEDLPQDLQLQEGVCYPPGN